MKRKAEGEPSHSAKRVQAASLAATTSSSRLSTASSSSVTKSPIDEDDDEDDDDLDKPRTSRLLSTGSEMSRPMSHKTTAVLRTAGQGMPGTDGEGTCECVSISSALPKLTYYVQRPYQRLPLSIRMAPCVSLARLVEQRPRTASI